MPCTASCAATTRCTATPSGSGCSPATPTAWRSCATGGRAATGATSTPTAFREPGVAGDFPARRAGPRPCWPRWRPSSSATRPTTPGCGGSCRRPSPRRVVEGLRPRIEEICDGLLDAALERGEVDLVADYAYPLPVQIIVEMLGVPAEDHEQFRVWSDALARGLDPDFLLPPEAVQQRLGRHPVVRRSTSRSLIEERRRTPGDDLLTRLIQAEEQGDVLTQGELLSTCILLLVAGHETTVNLISGGALALMERPDQLARVRDDPGVRPERRSRRCCGSCARCS